MKVKLVHCKNPHRINNTRVSRWFVFKPKIPIWVNFIGSCNGSCWYILWAFGIFYCHLVFFIVIWYIVFWYVVPKRIWQPWTMLVFLCLVFLTMIGVYLCRYKHTNYIFWALKWFWFSFPLFLVCYVNDFWNVDRGHIFLKFLLNGSTMHWCFRTKNLLKAIQHIFDLFLISEWYQKVIALNALTIWHLLLWCNVGSPNALSSNNISPTDIYP
jgi:hypothetical protein